jgi:tRNA-specific 2-thiouridylase
MMRLWSDPSTENLCCTPDSFAIARNICRLIGIPFQTIDAVDPFRERVVQYFIESYRIGQTPNPCVACNRYFRWDLLRAKATEISATHIASGHYARLKVESNGQVQLLRGEDPDKDQSYVLHGLSQETLSSVVFPLGEYTKVEIREMARAFDLPVAERPDSQDLCFVGQAGYRDFLVRHAPEVIHPGPITNLQGEILGEHQGLAFYTIGQRKGLGISAEQPYYVLTKDVAHNTLVIATRQELGRRELMAGNLNWISGEPPSESFPAAVKIRYKTQDVPAHITPLDGKRAHVLFEHPLRDITPGQAAVFYRGEVCLGGGTILPDSH